MLKRLSRATAIAGPKWVVVIVLALFLAGCGDSYSWHQKMTVEVETPDGVKSGSAVTSVKWTDNAFSGGWGGAPMHLEARGEAVVVDLGEATQPRYLFALLKGAGTEEYIGSVAAASISDQKGRVINKELFAEVEAKRGRAVGEINVPFNQYPLLIVFGDITKPETVKRVDSDNLAATFAEGYALKSITLEITNEPVTDGRVDKVLGRRPGDGSVDAIWRKLSSEQRSMLSSVNWVKD